MIFISATYKVEGVCFTGFILSVRASFLPSLCIAVQLYYFNDLTWKPFGLGTGNFTLLDLISECGWFDTRFGQWSFRGLMISHCDRIHSSVSVVHCLDIGYVGKQPVAWKKYCAEYSVKDLQESMDRCTGLCDITEILLKQL